MATAVISVNGLDDTCRRIGFTMAQYLRANRNASLYRENKNRIFKESIGGVFKKFLSVDKNVSIL